MDNAPNKTMYSSGGFGPDADNNQQSIIKGPKVNFTNGWQWQLDSGEILSPTRVLVVLELLKLIQKWIGEKPVETRILEPSERFPDIAQMNEEAPRSEWREFCGNLIGPWQKTYVVYMLDPKTMAGLTYPTSTIGGMRAISELREATQRARMLSGPNLFPLVCLSDAPMKTRFGERRRPLFKIQKFIPLGVDTPPPPAQIEQSRNDPIRPKNDLNDDIPF